AYNCCFPCFPTRRSSDLGMKFMRYSISDTAEYGDYTRGPRLITAPVRAEMQRILADIQSGAFAREWIAESRQGGPNFQRMRQERSEEHTSELQSPDHLLC